MSTPIAVDRIPPTEFSRQFLEGMLSRMAVSFYKYGAIADGFPHKINAIESAQQRLRVYDETGNTEYLMDAANFLMIEFMRPRHPGAFFAATDSAGSPGRVSTMGRVTVERNIVTAYAHEGD